MDEKKYTLRDLTAADVFPMFKIVSGIGVKEFKNAFEADDVKAITEKKNKPSAASVGITIAVNIADVVFSNLPRCEDDIYRFLSGLSGMSTKEIAALPMDVFMNMVVDTIKKPFPNPLPQGLPLLAATRGGGLLYSRSPQHSRQGCLWGVFLCLPLPDLP